MVGQNLRLSFTIDANTGQAVGDLQALQKRIEEIKKRNEELNAKTGFLQREYGLSAEAARKLAQETDTAAAAADNLAREAQEINQSYCEVAAASGAAAAAIGALFAKGIQGFVEFDSQLRKTGVITGATEADMARLRQEVERLGIYTSKAPQEIAAMTVQLSRAGFSAKEQAAALEGIVRASEATGEALSDMGQVIGVTTRVFGFAASETGKVADILVTAANNANTNVPSIGNALAYVGSAAVTTRQPLEDIATMIGLLGDAGIEASQAGTNLRAMLDRLTIASAGADTQFESLVRGSAGMTKAYNELASSLRDAEGNMRPILEILPEMRSKLESVSPPDRDILIKALFGAEGGNAFKALLNRSQADIDALSGKVRDSAGAAREAGEAMQQGLGGALELLGGSVGATLNEFGELISSGLEPAVRAATELLNGFLELPDPVQKSVIALTGLTGALASAIFLTASYQLLQEKLKLSLVASTMAKIANALATKGLAVAQGLLLKQYVLSVGDLAKATAALAQNTMAKLANVQATLAAIKANTALAAAMGTLVVSIAAMSAALAGTAFITYTAKLGEANRSLEAYQNSLAATGDEAFRLANKTAALTKAIAANGSASEEQARKAASLLKINEERIKAIDAEIAALSEVKVTNEAQANAKAAMIQQLEISKKALESQNAKLKEAVSVQRQNSEATRETTTAIADQVSAVDRLTEAYERQSYAADQAFQSRKDSTATAVATNQIDEDQGRRQDLQAEKEYLDEKLRLNRQFAQQLRAEINASKDPAETQRLNAELLRIDREYDQLRSDSTRNANETLIAANEATLKRLTEANQAADRAITESAKQREQAIAAELGQREQALLASLQQGLITQKEYDRQIEAARAESSRRALESEIAASDARIAQIQREINQIQRLRQQNTLDATEAAQKELDLRQQLSDAQATRIEQELTLQRQARDQQLADIQAQRDAFQAAMDSQIAASQRAAAAITANADQEAAARDRVNATLERERSLLEAKAALTAAVNEAEQQASQFRIEALSRAIEIQQTLNSDQITSAEQRRNLEQELAQLGVRSNTSLLQLVKQRQAEEDRLAQLKRAALESEQAQQTALLELDIQRNELADRQALATARNNALLQQQAEIQAQVNLAKAQADGDATAVANAQQQVDLARQQLQIAQEQISTAEANVAANQKLYEIQRQTLAVKQETARRAFEQQEAQRKLNQQADLTNAKEQALGRSKAQNTAQTKEQGAAQAGVTAAVQDTNIALDQTRQRLDAAQDAAAGLKQELEGAAAAASGINPTTDFGKTITKPGGSSPLYNQAQRDAFEFLLPSAQQAIEEAKKRLATELDLGPQTRAILEKIAKTDNLFSVVGPDGKPIGERRGTYGSQSNPLLSFTKTVVNEEAARRLLKLAEEAKQTESLEKKQQEQAANLSQALDRVSEAAQKAADEGLYSLAQRLNEIANGKFTNTAELQQRLAQVNLPQLEAAKTFTPDNQGIESRLDQLIAATEKGSGPRLSIGTLVLSSAAPVSDAAKVIGELTQNLAIREGL